MLAQSSRRRHHRRDRLNTLAKSEQTIGDRGAAAKSAHMTMSDDLRLPCLSCPHPQAADVKHALGQGALDDGRNRSPSGLPLMCCKIRVVAAAPSLVSSAPVWSARRTG